MVKLSMNEMANIEGGSWLGCAGFALGAISLGASIALTGGLSAILIIGLGAGTIGTGISLGDCMMTPIQ